MQSWAWTNVKVVPQLLKILESCKFENVNAGIVVLLGQLGRYVFDKLLGTIMFLASNHMIFYVSTVIYILISCFHFPLFAWSSFEII